MSDVERNESENVVKMNIFMIMKMGFEKSDEWVDFVWLKVRMSWVKCESSFKGKFDMASVAQSASVIGC